jgi:hypothetical protein
MIGAGPVTEAKGRDAAEISRGLFDVQLRFADVFSAKAGLPLAEAITFHTNFHRLFAYGNLSKQAPDGEFLNLVDYAIAAPDRPARLDRFVSAYAERPHDPWPSDRFPFGKHFACEAPNADGVVRIHFRNRVNNEATGPLHSSRIVERRADLTEMFGHVARTWPTTKTVMGASWLYNTEGYRRLFPKEYADSRAPLLGPRSIHGLSTWGQFLDFRGAVKPPIAETFCANLKTLDPAQPWLSFPYQVLTTTAPFEAFRREYGL